MSKKIIKSLKDYLKIIEKVDISKENIYRGESKEYDFPMLSNWGRLLKIKGKAPDKYLDRELNLFYQFKNNSIAHLKSHNYSDLDFLMIAQHHGLYTRLVDFTLNPLVALFFAANKHPYRRGYIYISDRISYFSEKYDKNEPIDKIFNKSNESLCIIPPKFDNRIVSQSSVFVLPSCPTNSIIDISNILIISNKEEILKELNHVNINEYTLFPQLDKLTKHINRKVEM